MLSIKEFSFAVDGTRMYINRAAMNCIFREPMENVIRHDDNDNGNRPVYRTHDSLLLLLYRIFPLWKIGR